MSLVQKFIFRLYLYLASAILGGSIVLSYNSIIFAYHVSTATGFPTKIPSEEEQLQMCGVNATWQLCSRSRSQCAKTCDLGLRKNPNLFVPNCLMICGNGCDPKGGFAFLKGQSGQIVRIEDCPIMEAENVTKLD